MTKEDVLKKADAIINNIKSCGKEELIHGKYQKAFLRLKSETDKAIAEYLVYELYGSLYMPDNIYTVFTDICNQLNRYLGKAVFKEMNLELVDMLLISAKNEFVKRTTVTDFPQIHMEIELEGGEK